MKHCAGSRGESAEQFHRNNGAPEKHAADGAERGYPLTSEKQAAIAVAVKEVMDRPAGKSGLIVIDQPALFLCYGLIAQDGAIMRPWHMLQAFRSVFSRIWY